MTLVGLYPLRALELAWNLFGSRKKPKPEKCLEIAQNPQRLVDAVLGAFLLVLDNSGKVILSYKIFLKEAHLLE